MNDRPLQARHWTDKRGRKGAPEKVHTYNIVALEEGIPDTARKHIAAKLLLCLNPTIFDAEIARLTGLSDTGVGKLRHALEDQGRLRTVETRQDFSGEMVRGPKQNYTLVFKGKDLKTVENLKTALTIYHPPVEDAVNLALLAIKTVKRKKQKPDWLISALRQICFILRGDTYFESFPWHIFKTKEAVEGALMVIQNDVSQVKGKARKDSTVRVMFRALKAIVRENYELDNTNIEDKQYALIEKIRLPEQRAQLKDIRQFSWQDWLNIPRSLDLNTEVGWMRLCAYMLIYPCGLRPSDMLDITRDTLKGMNKGYILFVRGKNNLECGIMLDYIPALRFALKKWDSMIPPDRDHLWYRSVHAKGGWAVDWDSPWIPERDQPDKEKAKGDDWAGSLLRPARRVMPMSENGKQYFNKSGRQSYRNQVEETRGVSDKQMLMNGGWRDDNKRGADAYLEKDYKKLKGVFKQVEPFARFNEAMIQLMHPYLDERQRAQARSTEQRPCIEPDCRKIASGDSKYCGNACKTNRSRRFMLIRLAAENGLIIPEDTLMPDIRDQMRAAGIEVNGG